MRHESAFLKSMAVFRVEEFPPERNRRAAPCIRSVALAVLVLLLSSLRSPAAAQPKAAQEAASPDNATAKVTDKPDLQVTGQVVDDQGQAVAKARVQLVGDQYGGRQPEAKTDAEGRFVFHSCTAGKSLIAVQANGFAPQLRELAIAAQNEPQTFKLAAGHTLRLRVVDIEGKPIQGATFATSTWRGYRALQYSSKTDAEGRTKWTSAPDDVVLCDILHSDHMQVRKQPLRAGADEIVITMSPPLEISGVAVDALTGVPIPNFHIRIGEKFTEQTGVSWLRDEQKNGFTNGSYSIQITEPAVGYMLQIVAPDFKPLNSRLFKCDEAAQTFDFKLQPGNGPAGIVILPSGEPAKGAEIALSSPQHPANLDGGRFSRRQNSANVVKSGDDGMFAFSPPDEEGYRLIAIHDDGFAEVTQDEFEKTSQIKLLPWGRLEGRALLGDQPDVNRKINFYPKTARTRDSFSRQRHDYSTKTDEQGRFTFERLMPGAGSVSRIVVIRESQQMWMEVPGWNTPVEIKPNETAKVVIGGLGRPVVGQIKLDRQPSTPVNWLQNEPVSIRHRPSPRTAETPSGRYIAAIDESGRFTVPDVPAGNYQLTLSVNGTSDRGSGERIGGLDMDLTVPEGRSDEPLQLGTITAKMLETLDQGTISPEFVVEKFGGGMVRLSDFDGKVVLVYFWTSYAPSSIVELPRLNELHKQFAADPRLVLIGINCDEDPAAAKRLIEAAGYEWEQAWAGKDRFCRAAREYFVRIFPSTFLIGPDRRVLARDLHGEPLKQAIVDALKDDGLFKRPPAERLLRYPVTRFTPDQAATVKVENQTDSKPAVVVLAEGRMRMLNAAGKELWAIDGVSTSKQFASSHGLAIDAPRERIYISQHSRDSALLAFNFRGQKIWQVDQVHTVPAVDPKTGNLWTTWSSLLNVGETVVLDPNGNELATHLHSALDLTYDPHDDAFWLAGYDIFKLGRDGKILFQQKAEGWCCSSVWVNPTDGSSWIPEYGDRGGRRSRTSDRTWLFNADGSVRKIWDLPEEQIHCVAFDAKTGDAWVGTRQDLRHSLANGEPVGEPLPIKVQSISLSPTSGEIWIATPEAVLKLNSRGETLTKIPFQSTVREAWLQAL